MRRHEYCVNIGGGGAARSFASRWSLVFEAGSPSIEMYEDGEICAKNEHELISQVHSNVVGPGSKSRPGIASDVYSKRNGRPGYFKQFAFTDIFGVGWFIGIFRAKFRNGRARAPLEKPTVTQPRPQGYTYTECTTAASSPGSRTRLQYYRVPGYDRAARAGKRSNNIPWPPPPSSPSPPPLRHRRRRCYQCYGGHGVNVINGRAPVVSHAFRACRARTIFGARCRIVPCVPRVQFGDDGPRSRFLRRSPPVHYRPARFSFGGHFPFPAFVVIAVSMSFA